jgi:hypothetical protein
VLGPSVFEEIQVMGKYYSLRTYEAKILPDRNFIADMIELKMGGWVEITAQEYDDFINLCRQEFKIMP